MNPKKLLALLLALALTLSCGAAFAEEAPADEEASTLYDSVLLPEVEISGSDWMSTAENRAMFAVLLMLDLYLCQDEAISQAFNDCGVPTLFVSASSELGYDALIVYYFFEEEKMMASATYFPLLGQYSAFLAEDVPADPTTVMDALQERGLFADYTPISLADYGQALESLSGVFVAD